MEINIVSSQFHVELTPADAGIYDTFVIQDLIKEMAQTQTLGTEKSKSFKSMGGSSCSF